MPRSSLLSSNETKYFCIFIAFVWHQNAKYNRWMTYWEASLLSHKANKNLTEAQLSSDTCGIMPCGRECVVLGGPVQWGQLMVVAFPFHRVKSIFYYLKKKHTGIHWLSSIQFSNLYIFSLQKAGRSPSPCSLRIDPKKVQMNVCKPSGEAHQTLKCLIWTVDPAMSQSITSWVSFQPLF